MCDIQVAIDLVKLFLDMSRKSLVLLIFPVVSDMHATDPPNTPPTTSLELLNGGDLLSDNKTSFLLYVMHLYIINRGFVLLFGWHFFSRLFLRSLKINNFLTKSIM